MTTARETTARMDSIARPTSSDRTDAILISAIKDSICPKRLVRSQVKRGLTLMIASLVRMIARETHANLGRYAYIIFLEMGNATQLSAKIISRQLEDPKSLVLLHNQKRTFLRTIIIINLTNLLKLQEEQVLILRPAMERAMALARSTEVMTLARQEWYARPVTLEMLASPSYAIATLEA